MNFKNAKDKISYHIFHLDKDKNERFYFYDSLNSFLKKNLNQLPTTTVSISSQIEFDEARKNVPLLNPTGIFKWGELGIWASNIKAYQNLLKSDYDSVILMEDDILIDNKELFLKDITIKISCLPKDWEFFSYYCPPTEYNRYSGDNKKDIVRSYQDWSLLCYVVHKKGALKILNEIKTKGINLPIDLHIFRNKNYNTYSLAPHIKPACSLARIESTFQMKEKHIPFPIKKMKSQDLPHFHQTSFLLEERKEEYHKESLGKILVYKSYGGLGDIFFCLPALNLLNEVCTELHFAVAPRLVPFFKKYVTNINIVNQEKIKAHENEFDNIYELANYPAFRKKKLPYELKYPTHKKVKQHAIKHYIDCILRLHKGLKRKKHIKYPYFEQKKSEKKHFTLHAGAGFELKIWPTDKYAILIEMIHKHFPNLDCHIIKGPKDPNPMDFISGDVSYIKLVDGGMLDVAKSMESAIFHIGNDAGITHFAGAFNIPSLAIYGPTGPGSWGCFSEINEIVWGKKGVCNIKCNYNVVMNCSHRICLDSVTPKRMFSHLIHLFNKMNIDKTNKWIFIPNNSWEREKNDFILKKIDKEYLIEFKSDKEAQTFQSLLLDSFEWSKNFTENLQKVLILLEREKMFSQLPKF